jgi:tryptophan synthase beta chain
MQMYEAGQIYDLPDGRGHFGPYGGVFVAETLMHALDELKREYLRVRDDAQFQAEFAYELKHYWTAEPGLSRQATVRAGRWRSDLAQARRPQSHWWHKINNTIGQALLARFMGKKRVIAETGAGQHGVAAATVAARYGMECVVYMGSEDVKRQATNVYRMKLLGATVVPVESGSKTLKDALNEAMRDWVTNVESTFYIIGTVAGPHPYPAMVRDFNAVVGKELRTQMPEVIGRQPDAILACVGGGSNAMGVFHSYIQDATVRLIGVEAAAGIASGHHAATLCAGRPGVLHGNRTYHCRMRWADHRDAFDICRSGLSRCRTGACLAQRWRSRGIRRYHRSRGTRRVPCAVPPEGIMPALESSHALAHAMKIAPSMRRTRCCW